MKSKLFYLIVACLTLMGCVEDPEVVKNTNQNNFEQLWKIIDTKYCYLEYKNINWDSIHTVYAASIDSGMDKYAFFDLMGKMLAELKDGHVNLYSDFDRSRYWKWFTDYPSNFSSSLIYSDKYLGDNYRIAGGMRYNYIANGNVGYVYYGDFSNTFTDTNISNIFTYFSYCRGIIIDVRDNGGGYISLAEQLASYFFKNDTITGYICHKTGDGHNDFSSPEAVKTPAHKNIQWQRPVVILANRLSYSATNSFICRMKMAPNAIVIGDKSGGGGGLPLSSEIPNGWMVRFSACPMYDADMQHTEWGIDPDIKIDMNMIDEENGYDTIIERAIYYLMH
jgi:hypothetical protein